MSALLNPRPIKLIAAFLVAVGVACAACFLTASVILAVTWNEEGGLWETAFLVGAVAAYFAILFFPPIAMIVGLPLYALSVRLGWVSGLAYASVGFLASLAVSVVGWIGLGPSPTRFFLVPSVIIGGTAATLAFWKVARPDRRL